MARTILCMCLAVALFVPLARQIYNWNPPNAEESAQARSDLVDPSSCRPEPAERTAYMVGCLSVPAILFALVIACHRFDLLKAGRWLTAFAERPRIAIGLQVALLAAIVAYIGAMLWADDFFNFGINIFYSKPWWIVPILSVAMPALYWINARPRLACRLAWLTAATLLIAMILGSWIGPHNDYADAKTHFSAAFDPVVQVQLGKNLLADYESQYGLYPDFLAPVFKIVGLGVRSYSLVCGLLLAASYALLWNVLRHATAHRGVTILGIAALTFNGWLMFQLRTLLNHPNYLDSYFQYQPLRLVFPALAVSFVWKYSQSRGRVLYWLAPLILASGALWNLDSGVVALVSWLAALVYDALFERTWQQRLRSIVAHFAVTTVGAIAAVCIYASIKCAWFGLWPNFQHIFDYQRQFYLSGFYMLPMPLFGVGQLVMLIYLIGFAQAAESLATGNRGPKQVLILMLSVLGLGLFSYYQGRSHEMCLLLCWWPAMLLLPIYLDQLLNWERSESKVFAGGLAVIVGVVLISSVATLTASASTVCRIIAKQVKQAHESGSPWADDERILREFVRPGESLLVLSASAAQIHNQTGIPSLGPSSLNTILRISEFDALRKLLERRAHSWIYIDDKFSSQSPISPASNYGTRLLVDAITPHLQEKARTPHGTLFELRGLDVQR